MSEKPLYTTTEVSKIVFGGKVSKTTICKQVDAGDIPGIKIGNKWFIAAFWVQKMIDFGAGKDLKK